METLSSPHPSVDLPTPLYYQLVYTLMGLLPPPIDDTPAALRARNHAAVAKVAALLPVNADEVDLAANCIAARAQAEEMLRQVRQHAGDIEWVMRLNAQYGSMVRTSLSVHGRLMRVQALRHKREAIEGAANANAWTQPVAEQSMVRMVDPEAGSRGAARPEAAPAACVDQGVPENVSCDGTKSHVAAIETRLSEIPLILRSRGSSRMGMGEIVRRSTAQSRLEERDLPNGAAIGGRDKPGHHGCGSFA